MVALGDVTGWPGHQSEPDAWWMLEGQSYGRSCAQEIVVTVVVEDPGEMSLQELRRRAETYREMMELF